MFAGMIHPTRTARTNGSMCAPVFGSAAAMRGLQTEMDKMLSAMFGPSGGGGGGGGGTGFRGGRSFPALNAWETDEALVIEAELPGFSMENLDISLLERDLTIKGERKTETPEGANVLRSERGSPSFTRTVRLPFDVHGEGVNATLVNGVLTVTLPKAPEARPQKIKVNVG